MGRRPKIEDDTCYQKCCVCIRKTSRNFTKVTEFYRKKKKIESFEDEKLTIFDILENLQLLSYEITDVENTIICTPCKKTALDFFDFKVQSEVQQSESKFSIKDTDNKAPVDTIKKYLKSNHYDKLKNYILKNVIESMEENEQNELTIKPAMKIKTEVLDDISFPNINFIDANNVLVKIEKSEDTELTFLDNDDQMSDVSERVESNVLQKNEGSDEDDTGNEEDIFGTDGNAENETVEGITKTVIDNVEFISRIPDCLVNLEQKRKEAELAEKTRFRNPEKWLRFKQRQAKARGESYVNRKGNVVRAKRIKEACNCRFQCTERITEADRKRNFENHWGLADFALQKKFLFEHRKTEPIRRRRVRYHERSRPRDYTSKYYLDTFNEDGTFKSMEKVCETMFCNTIDICKNNLRTLYKKVITGKVQDMRGHNRRKQTPGQLLAIEFVKKFPYFHIEQQQTVRQMYKSYVQECNEKGVDCVKENTFRNVFSSYNETEFLKPVKVKEKCEICDEYDKASDAEKPGLQMKLDQHLKITTLCRNRRRWKKNGKAKAERRRLAKEQMLLKKQQEEQQRRQEPVEQQVINNYTTEMDFY